MRADPEVARRGHGTRVTPRDFPAPGALRASGGAPVTRTALLYVAAAIAEIAGCFSFWAWLRSGRSAWVLVPGVASLVLFAWLLTRVESTAAGRAYAAYGGVYIVASLAWLWAVEGVRPDRADLLGACLCLLGALVILFGRSVVRGP